MSCSTCKVDGCDEDVEHLSLLYRVKVMTILYLQTSCFNELLDLTTSNQEDGTVGLKQWPGGQQEWDKVIINMLRRAL